ncbi:hypothetical protein AMES_4097 [Amycolatopsis mediterranei S699]|uniref:Squalene cyclase n=2 Tax=Amycolatopsis mediterranei TaxID=33910 RepID=A0A0H3D772_AMYMU|nr:hypothetical protein [Amycolatopsis mediterranei]ADJ45923.1 conserved hypothetical protein [Amycolatopsis mediterranei U32]AEK42704.1 hypothetical protein RAM_21120 [Amycolatopsis mediterranei S699]AFO77633.1 hypothetical protein AMES_4097 [Amycolatopsis mediterranei S699]AGT84761.1 hypothetical protein B737_4097 [Amycolatopsis mediterranei RB]KDO05457.1 hypothetical protein DV26_38125 [Amycolatopsis mediterranei]
MDLLAWLRDTDPALRRQVERDLAGEPPEVWEATRARIASEGFGARLLAAQDPDGRWAGGAFFPAGYRGDEDQPWTATTWTLNALREWGLDAAVLHGTAELLDRHCRWEYDDLPYWGGEVDCCINAWTLANGVWLGADVAGIAEWFVEHRMPDGGWNCAWVEGSTHSSVHSTLNALKGLLAFETATSCFRDAGRPDERPAKAIALVRAARQADGTWLQQRTDSGRAWFAVDVPAGRPSKWLTLFATRVLSWWDGR